MTMRVAIILFLVSFASITCWLLCREPADNSLALGAPVPRSAPSQPEPTPRAQPRSPGRETEAEKIIALSDAEQYLRDKMTRIIIPYVDFENTPLEEALDFLRLRARELDPTEDDSQKGIGFVVRKPAIVHDGLLDTETGETGRRTAGVTGRLENKSLAEVLDMICEQSGYRWQLTEHKVLLLPLD
ncbi:MAG: hypothetical protein H7A51_13060 [Akkermansiaceae bacterium]|nr:hypothetical protein [Akkermansiaceae bacterium]